MDYPIRHKNTGALPRTLRARPVWLRCGPDKSCAPAILAQRASSVQPMRGEKITPSAQISKLRRDQRAVCFANRALVTSWQSQDAAVAAGFRLRLGGGRCAPAAFR